jgi:hypothetical protein
MSEVSTIRPRQSRVKSSIRVRTRQRRPLESVSITKSSDLTQALILRGSLADIPAAFYWTLILFGQPALTHRVTVCVLGGEQKS